MGSEDSDAPADVREMKKLTVDAGLEIVGFLNAGSIRNQVRIKL
jgi:hypothetical protein